jgi:hypothetical protein
MIGVYDYRDKKVNVVCYCVFVRQLNFRVALDAGLERTILGLLTMVM